MESRSLPKYTNRLKQLHPIDCQLIHDLNQSCAHDPMAQLLVRDLKIDAFRHVNHACSLDMARTVRRSNLVLSSVMFQDTCIVACRYAERMKPAAIYMQSRTVPCVERATILMCPGIIVRYRNFLHSQSRYIFIVHTILCRSVMGTKPRNHATKNPSKTSLAQTCLENFFIWDRKTSTILRV